MTNHTETNTADQDEEYWADEAADWYCNHDVPNGCDGCAYVKQEADMLDAITHDERQAYFAAQDMRWEARDMREDTVGSWLSY